MAKGPVPLANGHKTNAKRTQRTSKVSEVAPSVFIRSRNGQKMAKICENRTEENRTCVVCSRDVKRMFIGSLGDESGWKWMRAPDILNIRDIIIIVY